MRQVQNSAAVNKRAPGTFEALDIERFRLRAELTRLQFERGQLLAGALFLGWGVAFLVPQLAGYVRDVTGTLDHAFYLSGGLMMAAARRAELRGRTSQGRELARRALCALLSEL